MAHHTGSLTLIETCDGPHGKHAGGHPLPKDQPVSIQYDAPPEVGARFLFWERGLPCMLSRVQSVRRRDRGIDFRTKNSVYTLRASQPQDPTP